MGTLQTKYEWFLVSGFIEDFLRIGQKLHKISHNSMKNRGSNPILTNLVGVHPRNIHSEFEANPCSGSRGEVEKQKKFTPPTPTTTDTGWSLECDWKLILPEN